MTENLAAPCIYPTARYRDAEAMLEWLKSVIGFTERVIYRNNGIIHHGELALGSSILMFGQERDDAYAKRIGDPRAKRTDSLYVAVDDIAPLYERVKASGVKIEMEPYHTDYGSHDFACRDPEGNLWNFGTYWPKVGEKPMEG